MQRRAFACLAAGAAVFLMITGVAGASTFALGSITQPSGSTASACISTGIFAQSASRIAPAFNCFAYVLSDGEADAMSDNAWKMIASVSAGSRITSSPIARS